MPVGEDIVNASTHIQDKQAFIQGLNAISDELGISRDYLPIIMVTETGIDGTIDPGANNGFCGGLIQFCNGSGASEVGSDASTISGMSAVEQLPLIRQYLSTKGIPKGADLATAYLSILYPVAMDASRSENLGYIPPQSEHLYGPGGSLSKETIEAGLLSKAKVGGAGLSSPSMSGDKPFSALPPPPGSAPGSTTTASGQASLGTNNGAVIIGTYTKDCTKTLEWDWTMQGGKVYRGCTLRITSLGIQGGLSTTPMDGVISEVGNDAAGYGQWLAVKHSDGSISETFYAHMSKYADLPIGTPVKAGQVIGYVGNTGGSTGAHLHFEVRDAAGQLIDPNSVMQR